MTLYPFFVFQMRKGFSFLETICQTYRGGEILCQVRRYYFKAAKVNELTELLKSAAAGVIVDYKGITVEEDTKLRKELREAGVIYSVERTHYFVSR